MYFYVCTYMGKPGLCVRLLPLFLSTLCFEIGSLHWTCSSLIQLQGFASQPHSPLSQLQCYAWILHGCWTYELRSSWLLSKPFTHWAIFLAPSLMHIQKGFLKQAKWFTSVIPALCRGLQIQCQLSPWPGCTIQQDTVTKKQKQKQKQPLNKNT